MILTFPPIGAPPSTNRLDGMHWAELQATLAPWRLAARLALQTVWVSRKADWDEVRGKPCDLQMVLGFETRHRRDPHNYHRLIKAIVDELHDSHYRKVGGSSRGHPAKMIHLPRAYALWPDDTDAWVHVAAPRLVYGEPSQLIVTVCEEPGHATAQPQDTCAPDPDESGTVPPDASAATAAGPGRSDASRGAPRTSATG